MTMTTETYTDLESPAYVQTKLEEFDDAVSRYADARRRVEELKAQVTNAKLGMEYREAEILVNDGSPEVSINGSNKEKRDAQLKLACESDNTWRTQLARQVMLQSQLTQEEVDLESASHQMRGARLAIEASIAFVTRSAAQESLRGFANRT